ncbi:MAG: YncE family protein [Fidelibacterota bacterium]
MIIKNYSIILFVILFIFGCEDNVQESGEIYKVYVAYQSSDRVAVFNGETGEPIREVDVDITPNVADNPHYIVIDEVHKVWFVTLISSGYVLKYDLLTDNLLDSVFVGNQPALMEIDPEGKYLYVSRFMPMMGIGTASTFVHRIDLETMDIDSVNVGAASPHGIALNNDGSELWVASNQASHFFRIETERFTESGYEPVSYKIGSDVPDAIGINDGIYEALELVISPDGEKLFMSCSDIGVNQIRVFSTTTGDSLGAYSLGMMGMQPWHLITDPVGDYVYVACRMANDIAVINLGSDTGQITFIEDDLMDTPHGIGVSSKGDRLFVTGSAMMSGSKSYLHIIDTETNLVIENVFLGEGVIATGLAVMQTTCNGCD